MPHRTEASPPVQAPPQETDDPVERLMSIAARLLSEVDPAADFATGNRLALAWQLTGDDADELRERLLARMPDVEQTITRGEYALRLRRQAVPA